MVKWMVHGRVNDVQSPFSGIDVIRTYISVMPFDLTALARAGAQARLAELHQEMDDLRRAFPEFDGVKRRGGR
jgi:hypothetical protein